MSRVVIAAAAVTGTTLALAYLLRRRSDVAPSVEGVDAATSAARTTLEAAPTSTLSDEKVAARAKRGEEANRCKDKGNKRFQGRQYELAIKEYTLGLDLADPTDPDTAKLYGNRAQCYASLQKYEDAERDCDESLKIDPKYVKALVRRAAAREKLERPEEVRRLTTLRQTIHTALPPLAP